MPTPPKPVKVLTLEGRPHTSRRDLAARKAAEEKLLTGCPLKEDREVREDPVAHQTFVRTKKLLAKIEKNDDLYHGSINRYCILASEVAALEQLRDAAAELAGRLTACPSDDPAEDARLLVKLSNSLLGYDRQIQAKRKMMYDIERENVMTIAASLRSVPKKAETKASALMEALSG